LPTRNPTSALAAIRRALAEERTALHRAWVTWIVKRLSTMEQVPLGLLERQLGVLLDLLIELTGPLRREVSDLWLDAAEWYGNTAAERGLAAGEIVEEFQYLRELLIRRLSELTDPGTQGHPMGGVIRLNQLLDSGLAHAVVGYTDTLVESLLEGRGIPMGRPDHKEADIENRLKHLEKELVKLQKKAN